MFVLYAKTLIKGANIYNLELRAKTVSFYLHAVNNLFVAKGFKEPFAPGELGSKPAAILKNYEAIQGLPRKRNPLTVQMISAMHDYAQVNDRVSFESEIFDWVVMSRYIGQRLSEFAQKTQHSPEYFVSAD